MTRSIVKLTGGALLFLTAAAPLFSQPANPPAGFTNSQFEVKYGAGGITSLKHAHDKYDTEYLSPGGLLGNVVIQYRMSTNNGWMIAREVGPAATAPAGGNTISYSVGTLLPTLPQLSTVSASANGTNAASLSDGQYPPSATPGGRGGRGGGAAAAGVAAASVRHP